MNDHPVVKRLLDLPPKWRGREIFRSTAGKLTYDELRTGMLRVAGCVNAGAKMHRRAGVKMHQAGPQKGPPRGPFLRPRSSPDRDAAPLSPPRIVIVAEIEDIGGAGLDRHRLGNGDVVDIGGVETYTLGGTRVVSRWLSDRRERVLSIDDINTFRGIVGAISRLTEIPPELGRCVDEHGGWPIV